MNSVIRIPTILGLGVLAGGLILGVFLVTSNQLQNFRAQASPTSEPKNITIANLSDTSVSIYWQTEQPSPGFIKAGTDVSLGLTFKDDRDLNAPQNYLFHFVTLTKLTANTTYFYKIVSGAATYPSTTPSSFTTSPPQEILSLKPVIGTVLDGNQQAVTEALVTLDIPGAQNLATITKVAGNFILPLSRVLAKDLGENFKIPQPSTNATLTVFNSEKSSRVLLQLPFTDEILPPITLGQDLDLTLKIASPTALFSLYDLNTDGVINSLDLATLRSNTGPLRQNDSEAKKNSKLQQADFNNDGIVDQKDAAILSKFIPNTSPR